MKKILTSAIVILGFVASTSAQATATSSATAIIVSPITITLTGSNLHFGSLAAGATGGAVILATDGTRTSDGTITLSLNATPVASAAQFTVAGSPLYTYAVTLPTALTLTHTNATSVMQLSAFTSSTSAIVAGAGTGTLDANGSQALNVGATLTVLAGQVAGTYSNASFPVTVNYN